MEDDEFFEVNGEDFIHYEFVCDKREDNNIDRFLRDRGLDRRCLVQFGNLNKNSLRYLSNDYVCSPKIDGERNLLVILNGRITLIARSGVERDIGCIAGYDGTVLDVEVINGKVVVLDLIVLQGEVVKLENLYGRIKKAQVFVENSGLGYDIQVYHVITNFSVDLKIRSGYKTDGVVFQPINSIYEEGYSSKVFKWKPGGDTVDLLVVGTKKGDYLAARIDDMCAPIVKTDKKKGEIWEVMLDVDMKVKEYVKLRKDKNEPNALYVVASVVEANDDKVSVREILDVISRMGNDISLTSHVIKSYPLRSQTEIDDEEEEENDRANERMSIFKKYDFHIENPVYMDFGCGDQSITDLVSDFLKVSKVIKVEKNKSDGVVLWEDVMEDRIHVVTAFMSLHHVRSLDKIITEISRKQRTGDIFFIRDHDVRNSDVLSVCKSVHRSYNDDTDCSYFSIESIRQLFFSLNYSFEFLWLYPDKDPQKIFHVWFKKK